MTPERLKCAVRQAPQRYPLLDNGSLGMFPQQQMGLWKPKRCYEINIHFCSNGLAENNGELLDVVICIRFPLKL
jgi:hypothetical protein